jgi:hypothetical protein
VARVLGSSKRRGAIVSSAMAKVTKRAAAGIGAPYNFVTSWDRRSGRVPRRRTRQFRRLGRNVTIPGNSDMIAMPTRVNATNNQDALNISFIDRFGAAALTANMT